MNNDGTVSEKMLGKNKEKIPNVFFHLMTGIMKLMDIFGNYSNKRFEVLNLKAGQTVIDYGCGPARYIKNASEKVGENGKVFAVDIHPLAIKKAESKIKKYKLDNVEVVLSGERYKTPINSLTADAIYALDMFHMIQDPNELLSELNRLLKNDGTLILEDGHQSRSETKEKILKSGKFKIIEENSYHLRCNKLN